MDVNLALGRESWQSSSRTNQESWLAVDGNRESENRYCTHTRGNPYLAYGWLIIVISCELIVISKWQKAHQIIAGLI